MQKDQSTAATLADELAAGRSTSTRLVEDALARIAAMDRKGPCLRAVIEINPDALQIAAALDEEHAKGSMRGPLHGIPVLIKDNIATGDKMRTTCGSLALVDKPAAKDAHLIKLLRERGLVILGKTNLSEWANFRDDHSVSGWSAHGGLTRNPYCLDRSASGSSSGSGVAVAANYVALAVGTETDGSITSPANLTSTVGLKPTVGLVSRTGIIPVAFSQDTAGPMTRTVRDAALLLTALAGSDTADEITLTAPGGVVDYTSFLDENGLKGARLGVLRELGEGLPVSRVMEETLDKLRELGAILVDPVTLPKNEEYKDEHSLVLLCEFKHAVSKYLREFAPDCGLRDLNDIVEWNKREAEREFVYFEQDKFERALATNGIEDADYVEARRKCVLLSRTEGIEKALATHQLDALIAPSGDPAWMIDTVNGDKDGFFFSTAAAVAGLPHLSVPMGFVRGLPVGLSFVGPTWSEGLLLKFGYAFEQATQARRSPEFHNEQSRLAAFSPSAHRPTR